MIFIETKPDLESSLQRNLLAQAAQAVLEHQSADADLTLVLTDDARSQELNRQYLGRDYPTDVLSFPARETDPETGRLYLGDVVISYPRARSQAEAGGHSVEAELQLLVVHGVLHLLGHDHARAEEKKCMRAAQTEVLACIGVSASVIREM